MAEKNDVELKDLLPDDFPEMESAVRKEIEAEGAKGLPAVAWNVTGAKAEAAVRDALDGGVYELMAKAWATAKELHEYTDETLHPAAETSLVHLGEHEVAVRVHPELAVTVAGKKLPPLRLTFELTAQVTAVTLTVKDRHIREVGSGDCVVSVQLKCGETPLHDRVKTKPLKLPGTVTLPGNGVAIL